MNPAWQDLQAKCDELVAQWRVGCPVDLTTTAFVDVRDEHDPITARPLEEPQRVA